MAVAAKRVWEELYISKKPAIEEVNYIQLYMNTNISYQYINYQLIFFKIILFFFFIILTICIGLSLRSIL